MLATKYYVHIIKIMNKVFICVLGVLLLTVPYKVFAISNDVVISEIQTESTASASEEYIVLANISSLPVNITGWHLQYFSAGVTSFISPTRNITLTGTLPTGGTYMAASTGYKIAEANVFFGATLSATGGHVRLVSGSGATEQEHDRVGWGNAALSETVPADLVVKGSPYKRQKVADVFIDTNNNKNDFSVPLVVVPVTPIVLSTSATLDVIITELLPNPATPATDANDEFVELYNNSNSSAVLSGYSIQTGLSYSYSYTFKDEVMSPNSYAVFYSSGTKLTLSNTSGKARLIGPHSTVLSETAEYSKAESGSSWQLLGDSWGWTTLPSPGVENTTPLTQAKLVSAETVTKKTAPSSAGSKLKTSVVKSATVIKPVKEAQAKTSYTTPKSDGSKLPANPLVLAGVGIIAVGYMVYEYRHDMANKFRQFKRNRSISKKAGI